MKEKGRGGGGSFPSAYPHPLLLSQDPINHKRFQFGKHERNATRTLKGNNPVKRRIKLKGGPKHQGQANCTHQKLTTMHPKTMCRQRSHSPFEIEFIWFDYCHLFRTLTFLLGTSHVCTWNYFPALLFAFFPCKD